MVTRKDVAAIVQPTVPVDADATVPVDADATVPVDADANVPVDADADANVPVDAEITENVETRDAPLFVSEGMRQDIETHGSANDPNTGQKVTRDNL